MPMKWDEAAFNKLFLAMLATNVKSLKFDNNAIAELMGSDCSAKAISHQMPTVRAKLNAIADGTAVDDILAEGGGGNKKTSSPGSNATTTKATKLATPKTPATKGSVTKKRKAGEVDNDTDTDADETEDEYVSAGGGTEENISNAKAKGTRNPGAKKGGRGAGGKSSGKKVKKNGDTAKETSRNGSGAAQSLNGIGQTELEEDDGDDDNDERMCDEI